MVHKLHVLIVGVATAMTFAVMAAAPAAAGESEYLELLQPKYVFLSTQQLLDEGHKVCGAERSGTISADAVKMVQKDLLVGVGVAADIVSAAAVQLGC